MDRVPFTMEQTYERLARESMVPTSGLPTNAQWKGTLGFNNERMLAHVVVQRSERADAIVPVVGRVAAEMPSGHTNP